MYDGRHHIGPTLAGELVALAQRSVGAHHAPPYQLQVRYAVEDLRLVRERLAAVETEITQRLDHHGIGRLLQTIPGVGPSSAAHLLAELGHPADFPSAKAVAAFVGVVPGLRHSGAHRPLRAPLHPTGHARLRRALWMPTLTAVRVNPVLRHTYRRLVARGKPKKVALIAAMHKLLRIVYAVARDQQPFVAPAAA